MKNKVLTISLLIAVVSIWAWIMFSVFDYMDSPDKISMNKKTIVSVILTDSVEVESVLDLDYKDPFLKKEYSAIKRLSTNTVSNIRSVEKSRTNHNSKYKNEIVSENILIPTVKYAGRIQNAKLNKPIAILFINNKEYMMQEGEVNDGVLLKEITKDSVKVAFSKKIFYVKR